jgi:hypothetical protein
MKARCTNIRVRWDCRFDYPDEGEIRIDWNNDRHQSIHIKSRNPEDVLTAFQEATRMLSMEIYNKEI